MTVGISTTNVSHPTLNWLRGVAPSAIAGLYAQLHTADPGAAGTTAVSAVTARKAVTMNAASGGAITLSSAAGSWAMTATEVITHLSIFDAASGGNFLFSVILTASRSVVAGDTLTLTALTVAHSPLAA